MMEIITLTSDNSEHVSTIDEDVVVRCAWTSDPAVYVRTPMGYEHHDMSVGFAATIPKGRMKLQLRRSNLQQGVFSALLNAL
jgi:hypothetical protein